MIFIAAAYETARPFDSNDYYLWLTEKIKLAEPEHVNYSLLIDRLHHIPFTWTVDHDVNRSTDGFNLRIEYSDEADCYIPYDPADEGCTVLEMLVALSERIEYDLMSEPGEERPERWFWLMLENLGLLAMTDEFYDPIYIQERVDKWLDRRITVNGKGGPFPLKHRRGDQRDKEIWAQCQDYLNENYVVY